MNFDPRLRLKRVKSVQLVALGHYMGPRYMVRGDMEVVTQGD
jgi:hypothetical protein